jgi:two-component system response regulator MprA
MMEQRAARILVVDDEDAIRLTLDLLLRKRGYTVVTAADGAAALALIEQQPFDLLLLDLMMPGLNGIEVARRAQTLQPAAAVLILTGSSPLEGAGGAEELEQFDYLLKTASPQDVPERVAAILRERSSR